MSIFPYIYYMIKDFHITDNDKQIALYAGLVTSAFALAECLAGPLWGRLSDKYGRKPILLAGLAGTGISVMVFGFAQNLQTALLARALGGLLNGNIGVLQTTVAEVVNSEENQARCYAMMPFVWCLGAIIGSALGGALADPVRNYPAFFHAGTMFDRYPYLLTNLVCAAVVIFSLSVGVLFLEETHEDKRTRRDVGLEIGSRMIERFRKIVPLACFVAERDTRSSEFEAVGLMNEELPPPGYSSTVASPILGSTEPGDLPPAYQSQAGSPRISLELLDNSEEMADPEAMRQHPQKANAGISAAFTKQVMLNIAGFGILAYLPESDTPNALPFHFTGGFALSTKTIGGILAAQGFVQMFATLVLFPFVNRRIGSLATYRLVVLTYPLLYIVVPYLTLVPVAWRTPAIWIVVVWKVTAQALAFPSSSIMLANSAPSKKVLGTLNGVASSAASGFRAFGPTLSGLFQSAGLSVGVLGLPWWVTAVVACCGSVISMAMIEERRNTFANEKTTDIEVDVLNEVAAEVSASNAARVVTQTSGSSDEGLLSPPGSPMFTRKNFAISHDTSRSSSLDRSVVSSIFVVDSWFRLCCVGTAPVAPRRRLVSSQPGALHARPLATMSSKKRALDQDDASVDAASPPLDHGNSTSNFRNVSACNRCDQKLPRCSGCEKAKVKCVGFDPVSRREIPRSYVYYLETRVNNLEALLKDHGITYPPPSEDFSISDAIKPGVNVPFPAQDDTYPAVKRPAVSTMDFSLDPALQEPDSPARLNHLVHDVGMVSVQGTSDARLQSSNPGTSSGIPFSRVVFAAVKSSVSHTPSERGTAKLSNQLPSETTSDNGGNSSFFALQTKPSVKPAPFPDKSVGDRLVELYFEHANPQIPILHRPQFMSLFDRIYNTEAKKRTARELYLMNIVFAIGSGIIMDSPSVEQSVSATDSAELSSEPSNTRRSGTVGQQSQPEEYHAAAIAHLDGFLGSPPATEGGGGGLEELQAVLLLAGLALLRPVAPGLWYIIGVAVRLAVDLGLHFENSDAELDNSEIDEEAISKTIGRKQWIRDLKRRLWWCTYSLDRLVSTCVGRPFGIVDQVITTPFPSLLDDTSIAPTGFLVATQIKGPPSYKLVAQHYFRLRLLQSEILQVLQHRHADSIRAANFPTTDASSQYMRAELSVPYMDGFGSFRDWRANVDHRLHEWKESAPKQFETGVAFEPLFLELNYWQAIIMLYRQSLAVPETLAAELSPATGESIPSPSALNLEAKEDEQMIFMKVAQAGQTVLKIYRQLHRLKLVNYTFLATHHLFMSGKSEIVSASRTTMADCKFRHIISLRHMAFLTRPITTHVGRY
nr:positive regulator of purine utilization [Quercus suber]